MNKWLGFVTFMITIKVFKYVKMFRATTILWRTIGMAWRQLLREKGAADAQGGPPPRAKGKGKAKGKASGRDARDAEIARRFGFKP